MSIPDANELLSLIYNYYPRQCSFGSHKYETSDEYTRYLNIVNNATKRKKLDEKFYPNIVKCADGYCVMLREHSDYSNCPSIEYTILLHKNQPVLDDDVELLLSLCGKRLDLELYFSMLDDYFYYCIVETVGGKDILTWSFSVLTNEQLPHEERELIDALCLNMFSFGFKLLPRNLAYVVVPEIETELINSDKVTIFNCLYDGVPTRDY